MTSRAIVTLLSALAATSEPAVAADDACGPETEVRLDVTVRNVRSADGNVTITVYRDRPEEFLARGKKLLRERVPAQSGETSACLSLPGPGTYAIAVYHDEDGDRDFDRTLLGLPAEGYGFSNDPATLMSLPAFDDVRFAAAEGETALTITMRY